MINGDGTLIGRMFEVPDSFAGNERQNRQSRNKFDYDNDPDSNSDPDAHGDPDGDADPDRDPDPDANPDPDGDRDPDRDPDPDANPDGDADPDPDSDANPDPDGDADPDRDPDNLAPEGRPKVAGRWSEERAKPPGPSPNLLAPRRGARNAGSGTPCARGQVSGTTRTASRASVARVALSAATTL